MFIAKTMQSASIFKHTPIANCGTFSGFKFISGSSILFCLITNKPQHTIPTTRAMQAYKMLPERIVEIPYKMPIKAKLISTTENTSSFGFESVAIFPKKQIAKINNKQLNPPKVQSNICQSATDNKSPEIIMLSDGPSVVIAPISPI